MAKDYDKKKFPVTSKLISITFDSGIGRLVGLDADGKLWVESFEKGSSKVNGWELSKNQLDLGSTERK